MTTLADTVPVPPGATPPGGPFPAATSPGGPFPGGATPPSGPSQGGASTDSAPAGGGASGGVLGTRRARPALTLRVLMRREAGGRLRLRVTGGLVLPPGVDRAAACRGRVKLVFKTRGSTIAVRRVAVSRNCRFGTRIVARGGGALASATKLRVGARFGGNRVLEPASRSVSRRVR